MVLIGSRNWRENSMYQTEPPVILVGASEDYELEKYEALFGLDLNENDNIEYLDIDYSFPETEKQEMDALLKLEPKELDLK